MLSHQPNGDIITIYNLLYNFFSLPIKLNFLIFSHAFSSTKQKYMQVQFNYRVQSVTKPNPLNIKRRKNHRSIG